MPFLHYRYYKEQYEMMGKTRQMGYFYLSWYDELAMTGQHGK